MNNHAPRIMFAQPNPRAPAGLLQRIRAKIATSAPTIQLFQASEFEAAPYTHGDTKTHMPIRKLIPAVTRAPFAATVVSVGIEYILLSYECL
jgi:hypothetical protein